MSHDYFPPLGAMARVWTPKLYRNGLFYRVCHRRQITGYDGPQSGFNAPNKLLLTNTNDTDEFVDLMKRHCNQDTEDFASPFISVFEDFLEAGQWFFSAQKVFGKDVLLVTIDGDVLAIANTLMWHINDVERWTGEGLGGMRTDSEWLIVHQIAGAAIVSIQDPKAVRYHRDDTRFQVPDNAHPNIIGQRSLAEQGCVAIEAIKQEKRLDAERQELMEGQIRRIIDPYEQQERTAGDGEATIP